MSEKMSYFRKQRVKDLVLHPRFRIGRRGFLGLGLATILGVALRGEAFRPTPRNRWILRENDI